MRYKITIEYDGTKYVGWQRQKEQKSVQEVIEKALEKAFNQEIEITVSGRTDAGVHALGQVAHFDLDKNLNDFQMMMAINNNIPHEEDINIIKSEMVSDQFHSRFDAKMRHYQYKILNRKAPSSLNKNRAWYVPQNLDLSKMQEAAESLIGQHDFSSFRDKECQSKSPIKTLNSIKIEKIGEIINLDFAAKSFLHHMVRNIVGTLCWVGKDKISVGEIKNILAAKNRNLSGPNAPAHGLYLTKIEY